jgi:DNA polymerase-3 subunit epsilon
MAKQIVFDVETTGLHHKSERIVSLAAVQLDDMRPTGKFLHLYLNPDKESQPGALEVHGLTSEFLSDKPRFADVAIKVRDIIRSAPLVIHNASFDTAFLNAEFERLIGTHPDFSWAFRVDMCTLNEARRRFGNAKGRNTLDALTARFGAPDLRAKTGKHGALIDCLQLVNVYRGLAGRPVLDFDLSPFLGESNESEGYTVGQRVPAVAQADAPAVPGDPGQSSPGVGQVV